MDWRGVYTSVAGVQPGHDFVEPYTASVTFFLITVFTGIILRALSKVFLPYTLHEYALDFISTMEACAYFFENNFVYKYYGSLWFALCIVIQCFVCCRTFQGSSENPVHAFQQLVVGQIGFVKAVIKIFIQSLAGLASYRLAQLIWSLDLISDHHERYYEMSCISDLNVTLLFGFLIEMGASLSDNWLGMQTISKLSLFDELIKYANGSLMIVLGLSATGMYFNPAMASGHTLGCQGTALWEHFLVYWIGPFIGCFVAIYLDKLIHIDARHWSSDEIKKKQ